MSPLNIKAEHEQATHFKADANGCLFDPRVRELVAQAGKPIDAGAEALAAVRVLA